MDLIGVDLHLSRVASQFKAQGKNANIALNMTCEAESVLKQLSIKRLVNSLDVYEPSKEMLRSLELNFTHESLIVQNPIFADYLVSRQLEFYNACTVMKTLLTIEDISKMKLYAPLVESNVVIHKVSQRCYSFELKNYDKSKNLEDLISSKMDEVVIIPKCSLLVSPLPQSILCLLPHCHEGLVRKDPNHRSVAGVEQVTGSKIDIVFPKTLCPREKDFLGKSFTIIIRSKRTPFRLMYRALEILQESPLDRRYLFPFPGWLNDMSARPENALPTWMRSNPAPEPLAALAPLCLINETIGSNPEQLQAIERILAGPSLRAPFIVFGPPGTGKTTTIVEAILQLRLGQPTCKILVTAGSNSACDTIAQRLCEYFESDDRLKEYLIPESELPSKPMPKSNVKVLQAVPRRRAPKGLLRLFSRSICDKGLNTVSPKLRRYSNFWTGYYMHMKVREIQGYDIVVATLCTVGRLATDYPCFTHIFIDEAGASTEPEALIGIMGIRHRKDCHVILSGDHKQLGAVLENKVAEKLGLGRSLMERLLSTDYYKVDDNGNYDHSLQARLRRNYRSHPEIVRLYNTLYYDGELLSHAQLQHVNRLANWNILPNPEFPIIFQATHGKMFRDKESSSSYNDLEIEVVCWYVRRLLEHGGGSEVEQKDIGIVAPYLAQGRVLSKRLKRQGHGQVEVGTVESYQGREKPIIIVTLVRSFKSIGFMQNPRRINVFLSRAKSLLILVGNPVTLRHNEDFNYLINECKRHGTYLFKKKDPLLRPYFLPDMDDEDDNDDELINKMLNVTMNNPAGCKVN
ncbi:putative helicase MOV-10 [Drosophila tropicalis]|uniref:putative helicase MOV-10 n=1 Tax=Drosophila tropicalis TaxID=46794 RepID=UPI0035AC18DC